MFFLVVCSCGDATYVSKFLRGLVRGCGSNAVHVLSFFFPSRGNHLLLTVMFLTASLSSQNMPLSSVTVFF